MYNELSTSKKEYQPFTLKIEVIRGKNLPVGDLRTSDPYVVISIGNKVVGKTKVIRKKLDPEWHENFETPLLHFKNVVKFIVYDKNELSQDAILGIVEADIKEFRTSNTQQTRSSPLVQYKGSKIIARGTLEYSVRVERKEKLITVNSTVDKILGVSESTEFDKQVIQEFDDSFSSVTVRQSLLQSEIVKPEFLNWSYVRDLISDTQSLFDNRSRLKDSRALNIPLEATMFRKYTVKYMNFTKIDLHSNIASFLPPNPLKHVMTLQTSSHLYTLIAANEFLMWAWIRQFRRYFNLAQQRRIDGENITYTTSTNAKRGIDPNISKTKRLLKNKYRRQHVRGIRQVDDVSGSIDDDIADTFHGPLTVVIADQAVQCNCVFHGKEMKLVCTEMSSRSTCITLDLSSLLSISLTGDLTECSPYDLRINILSARLSSSLQLNTESDLKVNPHVLDGCTIVEEKKSHGWKPFHYIKKGTKLGAKLVLGTAESVISVATGTAGTVLTMASEVSDGVLSVVQSGASVVTGGSWNTDIKTYVVMCAHGTRDQITSSLTGHSPFWDKLFLVGIGPKHLDTQYASNHGISLYLFSGPEGNEVLVGQKFILYSHLISQDAVSEVDCKSTINRGGGVSRIRELTVSMDNEIGIRIEVSKGIKLLPPPLVSPVIGSLLSDPLSVISKLTALSLDSKVTPANSSDRDPRLKISFVKWNGIEKNTNGRFLRSKTIKHCLNPEWNEAFQLSAIDGLYWAQYVKIRITDKSRSGISSLMGGVFIPIEDFEWHDGPSVFKEYPVVPIDEMTPTDYPPGSLGSLVISTKLVLTKKHFDDRHSAPVLTFRTQLQSCNEFNTMFMGDVTSHENMIKKEAREYFETFLVAPTPSALYLMDYKISSQEAVNNKSKMQANQFHWRKWAGIEEKSDEILEVHVFENQRRSLLPPYEWGRGHLLPTDRVEFTDETGTVSCPYNPYDARAPPLDADGFNWEGDWKIDNLYTACDENGWSYGVDFGWIMSSYRNNSSTTIQIGRGTRRRLWVRSAIKPYEPDIDHSIHDKVVGRKIEVDVFENQRRSLIPPNSFSAASLNASDRHPLSDETGKLPASYSSLDDAAPPHGCVWDTSANGGWKIDMTYTDTDDAGWSYGIDFDFIMTNLKKGKSTTNRYGRFCRRRRWYRIAWSFEEIIDNNEANDDDEVSDAKKLENVSLQIKSKKDIYKNDTTSLLRLCKERSSIDSPIIIPWHQVTRADVVSPGILSLELVVNRYFGEKESSPGNFEEIYHEINVELFVLDCPAHALCDLISERLEFNNLRVSTSKLISSGTMTGDSTAYDADSAPLVNEDDGLLYAKALSLGSTTILKLDNKLVHLQSKLNELDEVMTTNVFQGLLPEEKNCIVSERLILLRIFTRYKLYTAALLGAGLIGPSFDESVVIKMLKSDVASAENIFANKDGENAVDAAKNSVSFLLDTAEMRIRDTCLCGWSHQGGVLENCLSIIINMYYIHIIEFLGLFFDTDLGLESMKGNDLKLQLILFFIQKDEHLSQIVHSSLRPYQVSVDPEPLLSLSLNIRTLVEWYGSVLAEEMNNYALNAIKVNRCKRECNQVENYEVPWEVHRTRLYISNIPLDMVSFLKYYLQFATVDDELLSKSVYLTYLDEKIRLAYLSSFMRLVEEYTTVLRSHDWTTPVPSPRNTEIYSSEVALNAVMSHIPWLCSLANDCSSIISIHLISCLQEGDTSDDNSRNMVQGMTNEGAELFMSAMTKLLKMLTTTINDTMESVSCVIFSVMGEEFSTQKIYSKWIDTLNSSTSLVEKVLDKFNDLLMPIADHLDSQCFLKLLQHCQNKIVIWYLYLIKESSFGNNLTSFINTPNKLTYSKTDCERMKSDYSSILEFFNSFHELIQEHEAVEGHSQPFYSGLSGGGRDNAFTQRLKILENIVLLMNEPVGSVMYTNIVCGIVDTCAIAPEKAQSMRNLLQTLFSLQRHDHVHEDVLNSGKGTNSVNEQVSEDNEQYDAGEAMGGDIVREVAIQQLTDLIKKHQGVLGGSSHGGLEVNSVSVDAVEIVYGSLSSKPFTHGSATCQQYLVHSVLDRIAFEKEAQARKVTYVTYPKDIRGSIFGSLTQQMNLDEMFESGADDNQEKKSSITTAMASTTASALDMLHTPNVLKNISKMEFLGGLNFTHKTRTSEMPMLKLKLKISDISASNLLRILDASRSDPSIQFSFGDDSSIFGLKESHTSIVPFSTSPVWSNVTLSLPIPISNETKIGNIVIGSANIDMTDYVKNFVSNNTAGVSSSPDPMSALATLSNVFKVDILTDGDISSKLGISSMNQSKNVYAAVVNFSCEIIFG